MDEEVTQFKDVMSLKELREKLNISPAVAYTLARENRLPVPTLRVGGLYRFSRRAFDDVMRRQHTRGIQEEGKTEV